MTFEAVDGGMTLMSMQVDMPEPEDPEAFMEESAAGLSTSLAAMDELVSGQPRDPYRVRSSLRRILPAALLGISSITSSCWICL